MSQKRPTPPGKGGAGNVTGLAAREFPEFSPFTLRAQLLVDRFAMPLGMAALVASLAWEVCEHG